MKRSQKKTWITKLTALYILSFLPFVSAKAQHVSVLQAHGQNETVIFSLQAILDSINLNNPGLQQFDLKVQSDNAMARSAKAWMAPTVGVGLSEFPYGHSGDMSGNMMPRKMLMVRLDQMFPNFGKQKRQQAYYRSFAAQHEDDRASLKNKLFAKARMAYYDAYIAKKKLAVLNQQKAQLALFLKTIKGRLAYSKADLPDVYKTQARLDALESSQIKLKSRSAQSAAILNALMNRPIQATMRIDTTVNPLADEMALSTITPTYVRNNRSDIKHTSDLIQTMKLKQKITEASAHPTFGISWDNMRMMDNSYMYSAMAMMSIPIAPWFSKGYKSKSKAIGYQINALQKMHENQVTQVLGQIRKDELRYQAAKEDLSVFKNKVIPAYAKTYQSYLNAFSENNGDIFKTLSAWDDLTKNRIQYFDKLSQVINLKILLEAELQRMP